MLWKIFFETLNVLSYLIFIPSWHKNFQKNKLFNYKSKLNALYHEFPHLKKLTMRLGKGGHSLAFIFEGDYVYKIKKFSKDTDAARFQYEKRITDAIRPLLDIRVPKTEVLSVGQYVFFKMDIVPGKILINLPLQKITKHRFDLAKQLTNIIQTVYLSDIPTLKDLKKDKNTGLIHGDMCSNILVDEKTMQITGIIDWEYAGYGLLKDEFFGIFRVRKKMRRTDIGPEVMWMYYN